MDDKKNKITIRISDETLRKCEEGMRILVLCQEKVQIKHAFFMVGLPCQSFCFFF